MILYLCFRQLHRRISHTTISFSSTELMEMAWWTVFIRKANFALGIYLCVGFVYIFLVHFVLSHFKDSSSSKATAWDTCTKCYRLQRHLYIFLPFHTDHTKNNDNFMWNKNNCHILKGFRLSLTDQFTWIGA